MSAVQTKAAVPAHRYISREALTQTTNETCTGAVMGEMRRAIAREEQERVKQDRYASTLVIAASIIAAVRLARDDISRPSPRVQSVIVDSLQLARSILNAAMR